MQAYDHMRGADYAYVCMPERNPGEELICAVYNKLVWNLDSLYEKHVESSLKADNNTCFLFCIEKSYF